MKQCATILSEVTGKQIVHVNLSGPELVMHYTANTDLVEDHAYILALMDLNARSGYEAQTNDVVMRLTGRNPITFREFAEENKAIWM